MRQVIVFLFTNIFGVELKFDYEICVVLKFFVMLHSLKNYKKTSIAYNRQTFGAKIVNKVIFAYFFRS